MKYPHSFAREDRAACLRHARARMQGIAAHWPAWERNTASRELARRYFYRRQYFDAATQRTLNH